MKDRIKQWLEDNDYFDGSVSANHLAGLINNCMQDLGLSNEWVSVDDENDYPQLMKGGVLTFWHKIHKCEVTGFIVENELEDKILQGQYSVIEQTKTTKWPMDSFSFVRSPQLPPSEAKS